MQFKRAHWCTAMLAVMGLAAPALVMGIDPAAARNARDKRDDLPQSRAPGSPIFAIVSLNDQRVTLYDAEGKSLQSPVSTGQTGYETPAGIFSIVQKKEIHYSNLYDDAEMPFMQRITWTGIALHAGALPGHPASHGCVRLPMAFAQRLFGMTQMGMRVILVREDIAPSDITHPVLFNPRQPRREAALTAPPPDRGGDDARVIKLGVSPSESALPPPGSERYFDALKSVASAKSAEATAAAKKAADAKLVATRKAAEAAPATRLVQAAEANLAKAIAAVKGTERLIETANTPEKTTQAEQAKEKAQAKVAEAEAQLQTAKQQAQAKIEAASRANADAKAAEAARDGAVEAANDAAQKLAPVSVFISRKAQRLYVRRANMPVIEMPVVIKDADKPLGTYVFTAMNYTGNGTEMRWAAVSMYKDPIKDIPDPAAVEPAAAQIPGQGQGQLPSPAQRKRMETRAAGPFPTNVAMARAALDRVSIPDEALERITEVVLPGSSLIISDEGLSREVGKDTDFVVIMTGEPQGALKARKREPRKYDDDFWGDSPWGKSKGGGGGSPFFFWFN
jgi:hypothetical protein